MGRLASEILSHIGDEQRVANCDSHNPQLPITALWVTVVNVQFNSITTGYGFAVVRVTSPIKIT